jgi:hypothetical protein
MLVIELARVVWRDTVAVLESDDGCDDSTPRPVDDGCDDSMRRPCSEYEARAFLVSDLAQRQSDQDARSRGGQGGGRARGNGGGGRTGGSAACGTTCSKVEAAA